jgi:hypothetical protein
MKVRLTEGQYDMVRLLKEGEESIEVFKSKAVSVNDAVNRVFNKLTFSTIAEILDGDFEIKTINDDLDQLEATLDKDWKKVEFFLNQKWKEDEDDFFDNWDDINGKLDDIHSDVIKKIEIIRDLLDNMITLMDSDIEEAFKDNRPININNNQ